MIMFSLFHDYVSLFHDYCTYSQVCSFRLLFSKTKRFEKFINGVTFNLFMYKISKLCLSKVHFGVSRVSSCIHRVFDFFGAIWLFLRVNPAFFAYGYLETLVLFDMHVAACESNHLDAV